MLGGVNEIGAERDFHPARIGCAVHRGDHRYGAVDDGADRTLEDQVLVLPLLIGHAVTLFQVSAGAETRVLPLR